MGSARTAPSARPGLRAGVSGVAPSGGLGRRLLPFAVFPVALGCIATPPTADSGKAVDAVGTVEQPKETETRASAGEAEHVPVAVGRGRDDPAVVPAAERSRTDRDGMAQPSGAGERAVHDVAHAEEAADVEAGAGFRWDARELSEETRHAMTEVTWEPQCPVGLDDLREVELSHHGFDGSVHVGRLVAHVSVVDDLEQVFATMFEVGFPLEKVAPAHHFDGDDDTIMAANASHVFNCRPITGGQAWSEHSFGTAIDINPVQNPYERDGTVLPPEGVSYLDRSEVHDGMLIEGGPVVDTFDRLGWVWGGRWTSLVDYMHFERP